MAQMEGAEATSQSGGNDSIATDGLVARLDEVVGQALDRVGALAGLDLLVVEADKHALVRLDEHAAARALLAVERALVGAEEEILLALEEEAAGAERAGVVEARDEGGGLGARDLEAGRRAPLRTIEAEDGALGHEAGAHEVVVDVRLPRHYAALLLFEKNNRQNRTAQAPRRA